MSYYEFKKNDLIYNQIETNPKVSFFIYDNQVYYNNEKHIHNTFSSSLDLKHVPHYSHTRHLMTILREYLLLTDYSSGSPSVRNASFNSSRRVRSIDNSPITNL